MIMDQKNIFYIDFEFSNGNYYVGEIFEVACISGDGRQFHSYVYTDTVISNYVQKLCNVNMRVIYQSPSFNKVMDGLINFIRGECVTLIAHGGYFIDFPLLITNCMKNCYDYRKFKGFKFIDSMISFRDAGYIRPGLSSISNTARDTHSALEDVQLLEAIMSKHEHLQHQVYTYGDILQHVESKLPLKIPTLIEIAMNSDSIYKLEKVVRKYVQKKSALNEKQLLNIVKVYYHCKSIYCDYS